MVFSEQSIDLVLSRSLEFNLTGVVENSKALVSMLARVNSDEVEVRIKQVLSLWASSMLSVYKHVEDYLASNGYGIATEDIR